MDKVNGVIRLSAGDLVGHLACRHLTALNPEAATDEKATLAEYQS